MSGYIEDAERRFLTESTRLQLRLTPDARALDPSQALTSLPADPTVSFLCHGNVCRSPLAERYVRACLNERGDQGFTVESAGFIEREGRTSPDFAVEAARAYDIDLTDHRSKRVTADLLARSDLVVVMDAKNYGQLRREFDGATDRAYFLEPFRGDAGNGGDFEIDDPYDQTAEGYERAYRAVTAAIDGLLERTTPRVGIDVEYPLKSLKTARTPRGSEGPRTAVPAAERRRFVRRPPTARCFERRGRRRFDRRNTGGRIADCRR